MSVLAANPEASSMLSCDLFPQDASQSPPESMRRDSAGLTAVGLSPFGTAVRRTGLDGESDSGGEAVARVFQNIRQTWSSALPFQRPAVTTIDETSGTGDDVGDDEEHVPPTPGQPSASLTPGNTSSEGGGSTATGAADPELSLEAPGVVISTNYFG